MENRINVLDHGYVRLIDHMGSDLSIVRAARVSYNADWRTGTDRDSDTRLIRYLWEHAHTSPFEHVTFTFEVKAPIFVFRQWHRHRTWSFNEISGRYTELPEEFYVPSTAQMGIQSSSNKQGRGEAISETWAATQREKIIESCEEAFEVYQDMLAAGVAREIARMVLPVATYSHMFATVDLLNLFKFFTLRSDPHAQYEIREYSDAMKQLIAPFVPVALDTFEET